MQAFHYHRPATLAQALALLAAGTPRQPVLALAGGTNLIDLMKIDVLRPAALVDLNGLGLDAIEALPDGGLRLGALARNADTAYHPLVQTRYPLLAAALLAGASAQLRNMATNGGNLLQRTRCLYFQDLAAPCNKRQPGSGCPARQGLNRGLAVLGGSAHCIATHPSDMAVALAALDAVLQVQGPAGPRCIPMAGFHRLPDEQPERDNTLQHAELITAIDLPPPSVGQRAAYLKLRDRRSFAFALVSVAAALQTDADGRLTALRVALGGVAAKPWRLPAAEQALLGQPPTAQGFQALADALLAGAQGQGDNGFKIPLARRAVLRALQQALGPGLPAQQAAHMEQAAA